MKFFLSSPNTQQQAEHCAGMDVLLSYGVLRRNGDPADHWINKGYQQAFGDVLIDSGAFSALNSNAKIEVGDYGEWAEVWRDRAVAVAGLDDISGDWRRSLSNYEALPWAFPTIHDTDPGGLLSDLVGMARARTGWLGLGLKPPRHGKAHLVRELLERIPEDVHVHGWALAEYAHLFTGRRCSFDSTNWWRDAMKLRASPDTAHLHYGECLEIVIKRYQRRGLTLKPKPAPEGMFA